MALNLQHLPPDVAQRLAEYHSRKQALRAARVLLATAIFYALLLLLATHVDRLVFLSTPARQAMLLIAHALTLAFLAGGIAWFARHRATARQIAYEVEASLGRPTHEQIVTLESIRSHENPDASAITGELLAQLEKSTTALSREFRAGSLVRDALAKKLAAAAALVALTLGLLALASNYQFALMLERFYQPAANLPRPSFIKLEVKPNKEILGMGSEAVIQAKLIDQTPAVIAWLSNLTGSSRIQCDITLRPVSAGNEAAAISDQTPGETAKMVRVQRDLYLFTKPDLKESFSYQVRAGSAQTAVAVLRVAAQPRIIDLQLTARPPAYSKLPAQTVTDLSQPLRFLPGTQIELSFRTDQPVERVELRGEKGAKPVTPVWDAPSQTARHQLTLKTPVSYEVEVENKLGFTNTQRVTVKIGLQEDGVPNARLEQPPQEVEAITGSLVEFRGQVEDDLGLAEVSLRYVLNPDPRRESTPRELVMPLPQQGMKQFEVATSLDLEKTGAVPGDTVAVELRARDTNGADGLSRSVSIRVLPVTRGAEEQRRIAALRAVHQTAQHLLSIKQPDAASPVMPLENEAFAAIVKSATEAGVDLPDPPTMASIFELLETEHYLTADPRHQADVRMLHGLLLSSAGPLSQSLPGGRAALLKNDLPVIDRTLATFVLYRKSRNLMWRLSGMRDEARRMRDMLSELAKAGEKGADGKEPAPNAEAMQRIDRRGALYMAAIQDLGADLIELTKAVAPDKTEAATQLVGEINETGYLLSKGAAARRRSAANRIGQQIGQALEIARAVLVPLIIRDADARRELTALHDARLKQIAGGTTQQADKSLPHARQWLAIQRLELEREPFAPLWPRVVGLVLDEHWTGTHAADVASMMQAGDSPTIAAERELNERLALAWRMQMAAQTPNVSDIERAMETTVIAAEYIANLPGIRAGQPTLAAALDAVGKMPVQPGDSDTKPIDPRELLARSLPAPAPARQTLQQAAAVIEKYLPSAQPAELLKTCIAKIDEAGRQLAVLESELSGGAATDLPEKIAALGAALKAESAALQSTLDVLGMQLLKLPGDGTPTDTLLLKLKDQVARYRQRSRAGLLALAAASESAGSTAALSALKGQMSRLKALHEAMQKGVASLGEAGNAADSAAASASLERSASLASAALGRGRAGSPENIRSTLAKIDGVGAAIAASRQELIAEARAAAEAAVKLLEADKIEAAGVRESLSQARSALRAFEASASRLGAASVPPGVASSLAAALADSQQLSAGDTIDAEAASKLRLALGDWRRRLDALASAVRAADTGPRGDAGPEFQGGPERAWAIRSGYEADAVRRRLKATAQIAQVRVIDGLLAGLADKPDTAQAAAQLDQAYAWAALRFRLDRSELAGVGVSRTAQKPAARTTDPTIEFLRNELGKARQQQKLLTDYSEATRAYLDLIGDYLLY